MLKHEMLGKIKRLFLEKKRELLNHIWSES